MQLHAYANRRHRRGVRLLRTRAHPDRGPPPAPPARVPLLRPLGRRGRRIPPLALRAARRAPLPLPVPGPGAHRRRGLPGHPGRGLPRARPCAPRPGRHRRGPVGRLPAPRSGRLPGMVRLRALRRAAPRPGPLRPSRARPRRAARGHLRHQPGMLRHRHRPGARAAGPVRTGGPGGHRGLGDERRLRRRPEVQRGVLLLRGGRGPARLPHRPAPARPGDRADRGALRRRRAVPSPSRPTSSPSGAASWPPARSVPRRAPPRPPSRTRSRPPTAPSPSCG